MRPQCGPVAGRLSGVGLPGEKSGRRGWRRIPEHNRTQAAQRAAHIRRPFACSARCLDFLEGLEILGEVLLLPSSQSQAADSIVVLDDVGKRPSAPIVEIGWMLP